MTQAAKAQEPSMEEILASIRRIIADDDSVKPKAQELKAQEKPPEKPPEPAPRPVAVTPPPPKPASPPKSQADVDAMLAAMEPPKPAPAPVADVLDLTEDMAAAAPAPAFKTIDGESDVFFAERAPEPAVRGAEEARRQYAQQAMPDRTLLSETTASAVDGAFNALAHTVLGNNARTLEDLVKEMLRPMLKSWLDDNLPGLVERIVRAEIERVSRSGRV
jgi:cell pole-organizing protein PopZ